MPLNSHGNEHSLLYLRCEECEVAKERKKRRKRKNFQVHIASAMGGRLIFSAVRGESQNMVGISGELGKAKFKRVKY
jgi:hypothetical protein